jgi:hypothetical protein
MLGLVFVLCYRNDEIIFCGGFGDYSLSIVDAKSKARGIDLIP